jgi:transketolase N-terminal domain/subunit
VNIPEQVVSTFEPVDGNTTFVNPKQLLNIFAVVVNPEGQAVGNVIVCNERQFANIFATVVKDDGKYDGNVTDVKLAQPLNVVEKLVKAFGQLVILIDVNELQPTNVATSPVPVIDDGSADGKLIVLNEAQL